MWLMWVLRHRWAFQSIYALTIVNHPVRWGFSTWRLGKMKPRSSIIIHKIQWKNCVKLKRKWFFHLCSIDSTRANSWCCFDWMLASWATIKKRKNRHGQVERAKVEVMTRVIRNHACLSHSNHMIGTSYKQHLIRICFRYGLKWCLCPHLCCTVGMAYGFEWMWVCVLCVV